MSEEKLPDPAGEPEPVNPGIDLRKWLGGACAVVLGTGAFLFLAGAFVTPTMGATRSTQLQWEERERQAQEAADRAAHESKAAEIPHER
jgi:hypothetical protein